MDPAIVTWIVNLVSGAIGGNAAGAAMKEKSLGPIGNTIAGLVGGGLGATIMQLVGMAQAGGLDMGQVATQVASGGIGGAVVMVISAMIKGMMAKKA